MTGKKKSYSPLEESPLSRKKRFHELAVHTPPLLEALTNFDEIWYVSQIHKVLIRYWHHQMSAEEAGAWQRFLFCHAFSVKIIHVFTRKEGVL